jgi:hypothetical protein
MSWKLAPYGQCKGALVTPFFLLMLFGQSYYAAAQDSTYSEHFESITVLKSEITD